MDDSPFTTRQTTPRAATRVRYLVLAWLCLAATIAYVQRNSLSVAESTIRAELGLSEDAMGMAMGAFFLVYALLQLPSGWLGHTWGTRRALSLYSLAWSGIAGLMGLCTGFVSLFLVRCGMGAAQAGIFPCSTNTIAKWFPRTRRSVASGALASFMSVGGALGSAITGYLLLQIGWRWTLALFALPGVLWTIGFWLWFRDAPSDHPAVNEGELAVIGGGSPTVSSVASDDAQAAPHANAPPVAHAAESDEINPYSAPQLTAAKSHAHSSAIPWSEILTSRAMWWIGGQQFFRAAGYIFFATWFATYLQETRQVSIARSGVLNSLPLLGVVVGSLLGGAISDWLLSMTGSRRIARQSLAAASCFVCGVLVLAAYVIPDSTLAVLVISAGSLFAAMAGPCAYVITIDLGGRHVTPIFSFMNMCGNLGAFVFPLVVPRLVKLSGSWDAALFLFAGINLAAAACWLCFNAERDIVRSDVNVG
jgi:MFS family permease